MEDNKYVQFVVGEDNNFSCPIESCNKAYTLQNSLYMHVKRSHGVNMRFKRVEEDEIKHERRKKQKKEYNQRVRTEAAKAKEAAEVLKSLAQLPRYEISDLQGSEYRVEVRPSTIEGAGNGVFALQDFYPNDFITKYHGKIVNGEPDDPTYAIDIGGNKYIDAHRKPNLKKGIAAFINRASRTGEYKKNCSLIQVGKSVYAVAIKKIEAGEELLCSYGKGYRIKN